MGPSTSSMRSQHRTVGRNRHRQARPTYPTARQQLRVRQYSSQTRLTVPLQVSLSVLGQHRHKRRRQGRDRALGFSGPARSVTGPSWGGCLEVLEWLLTAGRFAFDPSVLDGGVLLLETSEELLPARNVGWIVRSLGERGILAAVDAVLMGRPPVSDFTRHPPPEERARLRANQRDVVVSIISRYNSDAVICVGVPFGHT